MKSYETARTLFSFLGFCAGALIALGSRPINRPDTESLLWFRTPKYLGV
jgi:hypothetical protein